ncbi:MAG TPA: metallophosphoesterase [Steroidobacteraceae bacterium]
MNGRLATLRLRALACLALLACTTTPAGAADTAQYQWQGVERVVAFADVHGAYAELTQLLRESGLIDARDHWSGGRTHLVSLGDLLDRGADSRKVMDLLMRLQVEAAAAGGRLHVVLGNHEAMNVLGDLRYVDPGEYAAYQDVETPEMRAQALRAWQSANGPDSAAAFEEKFPRGYFGHRAALGPEGRYGKWLLAQPVAILVNDTLFLHAGPSRVLQGMALPELNRRYHAALEEYLESERPLEQAGLVQGADAFRSRPALAAERLAARAAAAGGASPPDLAQAVARFTAADRSPLLGADGPNWYRGAALCNEAAEADVLDPLLAQFGAARLVVGHTPTRDQRVVTRFDGRVVKLDAGMNRAVYRGRAAALLLEGGKVAVRYAGEPAFAVPAAEGLYVAPNALDEATILAALRDGTVTVTAPRSPGVLDVMIDHRGRRVPAVFIGKGDGASHKELAAYRLDRLLRLGLVPATVAREVQGQPGVLQARPEKWVTQLDVQQRGLRGGGWCALEPQFQLVYAFDTLLGNEARTPETLLFDTDEWYVYVTGHDQAFGTSRTLPAYLKARPPQPGAEMRRRLGALDEQGLKATLGDLVDGRARKAILQRRDALLAPPATATAGGR